MPTSIATAVENNFRQGLITEASGINFPENACTDTQDCIFNFNGTVERRLGYDFELNHSTKTISRAGGIIATYLWQNVSGNGDLSVYVLQVGGTLYFYKLATDGSVSGGAITSTVTLSSFLVAGAPSPDTTQCQFAVGNGLLFITHPYCDPFYVTYDTSNDTVSGTVITIKIRDFIGVSETTSVDNRPLTLTAAHQYNLANQGWPPDIQTTSSTSVTAGTGAHTFTVASGLQFQAGDMIDIYSAANPGTQNMQGTVTSYSGTSLIVNTTTGAGSSTETDWVIGRVFSVAADHNTTVTPPGAVTTSVNWVRVWLKNLKNYPSNVDVGWSFKNSAGDFDTGTTQFVIPGNAPAPKGHFIFSPFNQDRTAVSGVAGLTAVTTGYQRPSTCAFYAGRVWYAGVNSFGFNTKIYFSQIIERPEQYGFCYQASDPTNENLFDLLPSDGGVVSIPDAGTIIKIDAIAQGLLIFAQKGVWYLAGSTGIGFTANDYSITKISSISTLSASSFVEVNGYPMWWTGDGIYNIVPAQMGFTAPHIQSLTYTTIRTFYDGIPLSCKSDVVGYFNITTGVVQWLYKSTAETDPSVLQNFDTILNFNTVTNAFYVWTIPDSDITINGAFVLVTDGGTTAVNTVVDGAGDTVVDGAGDTVISYTSTTLTRTPEFKYLVSYPSSGSNKFTFAEANSDKYLDWFSYDNTGEDYRSYFITGYKIHADIIKKFQPVYVRIVSKTEVPSQYYFQGIRDFAISTDTGKFSTLAYTEQAVSHNNTNYAYGMKRLKIRGSGNVLQYKVMSLSGQPFHIAGWSSYEAANTGP